MRFRRVRLVGTPPAFREGPCGADYKADTARDDGGRGYTHVRIFPMPKPETAAHRDVGQFDYKKAVIMYRQHHKAQGKDRADPDTKSAPTAPEDDAVTNVERRLDAKAQEARLACRGAIREDAPAAG
jgi:hypothetical protein